MSGKVNVFRSLQAGRGLAALMVVFYHCAGLFSLEKYWHYTGRSWFAFGSSGVEYFFVLSGIVLLHAHWSDLGKPAQFVDYCWKRFRRIYPIYWVVLCVTLPLYFVVPSFGNGYEREPGVIAGSLLLLPIEGSLTVLPIAWTLLHEVMFYVVFGLMLLNRRVGGAVLGLWMAASFVPVVVTNLSPVLVTWISPLHLFFGFGLIAVICVRRLRFNGWLFAITGVWGFVACCVAEDLWEPQSVGMLVLYAFFAAVASAGFMRVEQQAPLPMPNFLNHLGDASYSLYLVHYAVLSALAKVAYPLWEEHPVPLIIPFLVMLATAISAGILVHLFVERPLLRWLPRRAWDRPVAPLDGRADGVSLGK